MRKGRKYAEEMPDMGLEESYQKLYNLIKYEELKGNISIEAVEKIIYFLCKMGMRL